MKQDAKNGFTSFDELPTIDPAVDSLLGVNIRPRVVHQFSAKVVQWFSPGLCHLSRQTVS